MTSDRSLRAGRMGHRIAPLGPGTIGDPGGTGTDTRLHPAADPRHGPRHGGGSPLGSTNGGGTPTPARGRSRGGRTRTSIAVTDALGSRVRCVLVPGPASDRTGMPDILEGLDCGARIADTAFDVDGRRDDRAVRRITAVIPAHRNRRHPREHDRNMSGGRHPIETSLRRSRRSGALQPALTRPRRVVQRRSIGRRA